MSKNLKVDVSAMSKMRQKVCAELKECAQEILHMQLTGILQPGLVRKFATELQTDLAGGIDYNTCLQLVFESTKTAALEHIVRD